MITIKTESGSEVLVSEDEFARVEKMLKDSGGNITGKMIGDNLHIIPTRAEFNLIRMDQQLRDAAPDLLEACKALKAWKDRNDPIHTSYFYLDKIIEQVESAIAKAEGINKET